MYTGRSVNTIVRVAIVGSSRIRRAYPLSTPNRLLPHQQLPQNYPSCTGIKTHQMRTEKHHIYINVPTIISRLLVIYQEGNKTYSHISLLCRNHAESLRKIYNKSIKTHSALDPCTNLPVPMLLSSTGYSTTRRLCCCYRNLTGKLRLIRPRRS